ncbi:hypothetical protein Tco_1358737, partial [Tanacetum coccineum]
MKVMMGVRDEEAPSFSHRCVMEIGKKKIESSLLMEMPLRGLHDINKVFIKSGKANKFDENE